MKRGTDAHLRRYRQLLDSVEQKESDTEVLWRACSLGSWKSISVRWWEAAGGIRIRFRAFHKDLSYCVSSIRPTATGLKILLSDARNPVPETLQVSYRRSTRVGGFRPDTTWALARRWMQVQFHGVHVISVGRRADLSRSLSGSFLRIHFRTSADEHLAVIADSAAENDNSRSTLTQALLYLNTLVRRGRIQGVPIIHLLVPSTHAGVLYHRARFMNTQRIRIEVWDFEEQQAEGGIVSRSACPPDPIEERDFRWPVLGPFRWSAQLARVLDLAPDLIRRYPRFQDYDSLRLWGLEFAQVMGPDRDRICFGIGTSKTVLDDSSFPGLRAMVDEILYYRRADSPDTQHPYYKAQAERWLEALILEQVSTLFPELRPESVYPQIPVYLGKDPGRVDILGADRCGNLVVMELKICADPDLPIQSLDYWGRVVRHNLNGDFERRGYFSGMRLTREAPKIYLVSPVFSFHDSTERLLRFLPPDLEVWKIAVNEDWRGGVRVLGRIRMRCGDLP